MSGRIDWDAVERDYRAGNFTLRELASKYGCSHAGVAKQAKKYGWTQDLSRAVKAATNARLIEEAVSKAVDGSVQLVTNTVLAAAEANTRVVLAHRQELRDAREVAMSLLSELRSSSLLAEEAEMLVQIVAGSGATPKDEAQARALVSKALGMSTRVGSVKALSEALTKLHASERVAFGISGDGGDGDPMQGVVLIPAKDSATNG